MFMFMFKCSSFIVHVHKVFMSKSLGPSKYLLFALAERGRRDNAQRGHGSLKCKLKYLGNFTVLHLSTQYTGVG